ncbi:putative ABC exporter domain-containing protein [Metallumcola ferriviriculae]|uniref:ABC exporter domain-containing protein n=1 Tax=Metallumcola ferriviriculae TaxID=3039180 RepID=A0AAU0UM53_9FIRM|nr:putative ABC exporter domain-containing protein [Desulfitibacteraceae bacterium MK1]
MNDYKLLVKKDVWTIKNHILDIKGNPKRLVPYLLGLFWVASLVLSAFMRLKQGPTKIQATIGPEIIGAVFTALATALLLYNLYRGTQEAATFFSLGDVHFLFPAPVSSKKILLYNMIKQSLQYFFLYGIVILAFTPSILQIATINFQYVYLMYLGYITIVLMLWPLNFLIFAAGTKYRILGMLQFAVYLFIAVFLLYIGGSIIFAGNIVQGFLKGLNASFINYLPIIGWGKTAFMTAISGYNPFSITAAIMQLALLSIVIFFSYWLADDYYEDVLGATEKRAQRKRQKQGLEKKQFTMFHRKGKVSVQKIGTGPWALLWRARVEYSRTDLHPYFSLLTVAALAVGLIVGYFISQSAEKAIPVYVVNGVAAYIIFIFTASQSRFDQWSKPYIYLIPGSPLQKIIAVNMLDIIRMTINIFVLNAAVFVWLKTSPLIMAVMILFVISFYVLNLSASFIMRVIFPDAVDHKNLFPLFLMLQILLLLFPGLIGGAVLAFVFRTPLAFFQGVVLTNLVTITILLVIGNKAFAYLEWR